MGNEFPSRQLIRDSMSDLNKIGTNHHETLLSQLEAAIESSDPNNWGDEPDIKITQIEKQKVYVWIRIYLEEEDDILKSGDKLTIRYTPNNEELECVFGAYEKEGLNKNHDDEVINYVTEDDKKILCCMIDSERINQDSEDIPTLRTFFRSSRYYTENIYRKSDLEISKDDKIYDYTSISF